jgi:CheY-like chemotaxis protein
MPYSNAFAPGDALRNVEVLYVDDESPRRDAMRRMLMSLGVRRVQVAENGAEALIVLAGSLCGLVIAQHQMKAMNGVELIREIRSVKNYPRALVPTLILGDPVAPNAVAAALDAGANHFLVKPITPVQLYERMEWVLSDARPFAVKDGHYVIKRAAARISAAGAP